MFALITGYSDPPAGIQIKGNLHYNRYFPGGAIAMAQNIYDGVVDFDDGTIGARVRRALVCLCADAIYTVLLLNAILSVLFRDAKHGVADCKGRHDVPHMGSRT